MLARGVLCRLAGDVPKTSTHTLARVSRVLQRAVVARNATSIASTGGLSHVYKLAFAVSRRTYATAAATKTRPAKTVKRVTVKKTVTEKPAARKLVARKPAAKKPAAKNTAAKKKTVPKKKPTAKKAAPKKAPTEAAVARKKRSEALKHLRELQKTALTSPKKLPQAAWHVFMSETLKSVSTLTPESAEAFRALTPAEREHYNHIANQNKATNEAAYKAWVLSHTPDQIRLANNARFALRRRYTKLKEGGMKTKRRYPADTIRIADDRQAPRALSPMAAFSAERWKSGDFKGIRVVEAAKVIAAEYKALSASEKKKYLDIAAVSRQEQREKVEAALGAA